MFRVITDHPLAVNSDDHKYPEGIYFDNNYNQQFVDGINSYFENKKINFMDLGCAGGELVCRLSDQGHTAIGLEGSDHALNIRPDVVEKMGFMPMGHKNWKNYGNKNLFTCDVTKPYTVISNNMPYKCDLITCWDVIEHFEEDQLDQFFTNVKNHMSDNGLFTASIHMGSCGRSIVVEETPENLDYHKTIHDREWWTSKLSEYFNILETYPLVCSNRGHHNKHPELFACIKK